MQLTQLVDLSDTSSGGIRVDGMGMSELYARVVDTERALKDETEKRHEAEQYLENLVAEMEQKTPVLVAQKNDLHRMCPLLIVSISIDCLYSLLSLYPLIITI